MSLEDDLDRAAEIIKSADALLITAGAGMGVDSGLPDFRGKEGFWKAYPVIAGLGLSFAEMANPKWFEESPQLAWAFYGHRLNLYRGAVPHPGFGQLLDIGSRKQKGYFVFTSNVDGHFQKAGFDTGRVVECHGSIHHFQCVMPCSGNIWEANGEMLSINMEAFRALEPLPKCRHCGSLARPNILMFWDSRWLGSRSAVQQVLFDQWLDDLNISSAKLAVIELGAGTAVPTVRMTSETVARRMNATLIRINVRESFVPSGQIGLALGAAEGIRRICDRLDSPA